MASIMLLQVMFLVALIFILLGIKIRTSHIDYPTEKKHTSKVSTLTSVSGALQATGSNLRESDIHCEPLRPKGQSFLFPRAISN